MNLLKMFKSFKFAFKGMGHLILNENNAKFHLLASFLVVLAGYLLKINSTEWIIIIILISIVWSAEAFNSAIEKLADKVSPEENKKIAEVKDLSAAGVLFLALASLVIALIIFLPKII